MSYLPVFLADLVVTAAICRWPIVFHERGGPLYLRQSCDARDEHSSAMERELDQKDARPILQSATRGVA